MSKSCGSVQNIRRALLGTAFFAIYNTAAAAAEPANSTDPDSSITVAQNVPVPAPASQPAMPAVAAAAETVIVTGTRAAGITAADSATPISIVGTDAIQNVGLPDLNNSLNLLVPSFQAENGGDLGQFVVQARLRGLSPNETLVLVNGQRIHPTGDFQVDAGVVQGGFAPDLSMWPISAIDHVEVLLDGAAALYGTDAVAGVINIILKSSSDAGLATGSAGQYYSYGAPAYDLAVNKGFPLFDHGFINLTYEKKQQNFTHPVGLGDQRIMNPDGTLFPNLGYNPQPIPFYPNVNPVNDGPWFEQSNYLYNAGYDINPDVHIYSFGTYNTRQMNGYENIRLPSLIVGQSNPATGTQELGVSGTIGSAGAIVEAPVGFDPQEQILENNFTTTLGARGVYYGFTWDLSTTYGEDRDYSSTIASRNRSLWINTGFTPNSFYDGEFISREWTNNLNLSYELNVGLAVPVTVAFGGEEREDSYTIKQGDSASTYEEGGQSFPGFLSTDAGTHDRKNYAGYLNFILFPLEQLQLDIAGRYEHYTDFGNAPIGKVTARYDFNQNFALRGTAATGFRAPTLAEEYYSATNVAPSYAFVQLPPDSAAAQLLGVQPLKPEHSTNYSTGGIAHFGDLTMSLDAYSISVRDRIYSTGSLYGSAGGTVVSTAINNAIAAHGNVLDPTVVCCGFTGVNIFVNGLSTDTKGLDFTGSYRSDLDDYGTLTWTLAANWNQNTVTNYQKTTPELAGQYLFSPTSLETLEHGAPTERLTISADWLLGRFKVHLAERLYGPTINLASPDGVSFYRDEVPFAALTDLEVGYLITEQITLSFGANNLFNKLPPTIPNAPGIGNNGQPAPNDGGNVYNNPNIFSAYGIFGGYYYARLAYAF